MDILKPYMEKEFVESLVKIAISIFLALIALIPFLNLNNEQRLEIRKKQFELVYLPLYKLIDPHLYIVPNHELQSELLENISAICSTHVELLDSDVLNALYLLEKNYRQSSDFLDPLFYNLCWCIEKRYIRLKVKLKMPGISVYYRINRGVYKHRIALTILSPLYKYSHFLFFILLAYAILIIIGVVL